jgi:hypothetical protein
MPGLPLGDDYHDGEESRRQQLLAVWKLRRNLERGAARRDAENGTSVAVMRDDLVRELQELIAALDRRVPRVERAGEAAIAREAAVLRDKAVRRLEELQRQHTSTAAPTAHG